MPARKHTRDWRVRALLLLIGSLLPVAGIGCHGREFRYPTSDLAGVEPRMPRELGKSPIQPYVIEPEDQVGISVRPSSLSPTRTAITVTSDGMLDLEFLGAVPVAGMTIDQAQQVVTSRVLAVAAERGIKSTPEDPVGATIRLEASGSKFYYVVGAVRTEGAVPFRGNPTVLDGVLGAGLLTSAQPCDIYLVRPRPAGSKPLVMAVDWLGITTRGETLTNYQLLPGDRIVVPGSKPKAGLLGALLGGS